MNIQCYTSITDVPQGLWDNQVNNSGIGLHYNHLKAVESSRINSIKPHYLMGTVNGETVGIAYCFLFNMNLAKMSSTYPEEIIETVQQWIPDFMDMKIIEVGHIASLGKTIEVRDEYRDDFLKHFNNYIDQLAESNKVNLCIIRDIPENESEEFTRLNSAGFKKINGFPIAKIPLTWDSLDSYSQSLKSKKRYNFNQSRKKMMTPEISVEVIEDYAPYAERLSQLWENVAKKNKGYAHEQLTPEYFRSMAENLGDNSHIVAIKLDKEIVAYGLNLIGENEYFGIAEGLDYSVRDRYGLYANNIYEALKIACKKQKRYFNIGITTYDFKTSIGAELYPCNYYIKGFRNPQYTSAYAKLIEEGIIQPKYSHRVFTEDRPEYGLSCAKSPETDQGDPFQKHLHYTRANELKLSGLYTFYPEFESAQEAVIRYNGKDVIMLGTNSYLGLSTHPKIKSAMFEAINKYGSGCSGSPLLNGTLDIHKQLTDAISELVDMEQTLLYSTGYQANIGAVSALVNKNDVIIMDRRNHASLIDGAKLSGAKIVRYHHNDVKSLEAKLKKYEKESKIIITDSVFSMEGSIINLPEIVELKNRYNARLMLDESHAIGVLGRSGGGVAQYYNLTHEVDIIMGTFSKSLASVGGFISGKSIVIEALRHISRSHIFSASLPPSAIAGVIEAIKIVRNEPERREKLLENAQYLADGLNKMGYRTTFNGNPIISVFCGHELISMAMYKKLFERGVFVNPVTSPAVPKGEEMLRVSVMATHTKDELDKTLEVFKSLKTEWFPIKEYYND